MSTARLDSDSATLGRLTDVSLEDKYALDEGRIYISGVQALVRLPLVQSRRDRAAGLRTGGFISGYRGSPLGGYDKALWSARPLLAGHDIHFQPGINEDLAATSIWGSQQIGLFPGARVDGVFAIWYGKGPGVDRTGDVFKHANAAGTYTPSAVFWRSPATITIASPRPCRTRASRCSIGGDDTGAPSGVDVQEYRRLRAAMAWALSRFAGLLGRASR